MKAASALGRKHVRLSAFVVVVVVVAGLVLAVSAGARTNSSSKPDGLPGLTSKGAAGKVSRPARPTIAPGITSNRTAISTPYPKLTGLVWLPR